MEVILHIAENMAIPPKIVKLFSWRSRSAFFAFVSQLEVID